GGGGGGGGAVAGILTGSTACTPSPDAPRLWSPPESSTTPPTSATTPTPAPIRIGRFERGGVRCAITSAAVWRKGESFGFGVGVAVADIIGILPEPSSTGSSCVPPAAGVGRRAFAVTGVGIPGRRGSGVVGDTAPGVGALPGIGPDATGIGPDPTGIGPDP